jgi:outer membrane biosynthesis protein TonB
MIIKFHWLTGTALFACIMAAGSPVVAQTVRQWVDPPSENATSQSSVTETRPATPAVPEKAPTATGSIKEPAADEIKNVAEPVEKPAAKPTPRKSVAEKKVRKLTREASILPRVSQQRSTREERVRRGIDSGLELMTLRTIEYPDGRRVQILTRPDPGAMSELLEVQR